MGIHKLHLDEFDEVDYELIAIHTSLEDFRLAFFINQQLPIILSRSSDEIGVKTKEGEAMFTKFGYDDVAKDIQWSLVQNKNEIITHKKSSKQDLFLDENVEITTKVYLLPELKKVDYFLKIENNCSTFEIEDILQKLNKIEWITTVYEVFPDKIKSKNNLIF
ncbi:IPExxxVDY family protein [Flavobacterium sp. WW92]|uniref:IPExxxVDY family protein n=1 Tax=unclassified Flavobacterium TaxID=196869 RepID=UPI0022249B72|nr:MULTISPECIES: IPExxxVDY family protein [unclassified Flavobacterium]WDO13646.1 IPExxxVDY family protein [Flavobacterium sp. WW92]